MFSSAAPDDSGLGLRRHAAEISDAVFDFVVAGELHLLDENRGIFNQPAGFMHRQACLGIQPQFALE